MRLLGRFLISSVLLGAWASVVQARDLPDFIDLVKSSTPAVVNISSSQKPHASGTRRPPSGLDLPDLQDDPSIGDLLRRFFGDQGGGDDDDNAPAPDSRSLGSGFIISEDGYILTNFHVINDADEIIVRLSDRRTFVADIRGTDKRADIALLKIDASGLPVVEIGSAKDLQVGEWVLAIGSPFGFDHSATAGIVSAKGRNLPQENYVPFIQTDVAINPGNSGGPLFNLDGKVVGINSQIYSRTGGFMGLSFAIPIDVAMDVADQLRASGKVSRGWLGVLIQDVTRELAESFGMERSSGALVAKVFPDGPAAAAGLTVGDVILEFDGREIADSATLPPLVGATRLNSVVEMTVLRDGKRKTLTVTVGELPVEDTVETASSAPPAVRDNRLGISVAELSAAMRDSLGVERGVVVTEVRQGPGRRAGIQEGDVVAKINGLTVEGVADFEQRAEGLPAGRSIAVLVHRQEGPLFLALKIEP
ncbi:MAG: DegQ family serine endoprotease [Chromatiales bacterium]|nr:DegQ family serine endoprotease [Chromatiales bacterium]